MPIFRFKHAIHAIVVIEDAQNGYRIFWFRPVTNLPGVICLAKADIGREIPDPRQLT